MLTRGIDAEFCVRIRVVGPSVAEDNNPPVVVRKAMFRHCDVYRSRGTVVNPAVAMPGLRCQHLG